MAKTTARLDTFSQLFLAIFSSLFNDRCTPDLDGLLDDFAPKAVNHNVHHSTPGEFFLIIRCLSGFKDKTFLITIALSAPLAGLRAYQSPQS